MLYRQEAPYLRYEQIPVSSTTYNYSPRHATQPTELKKHGILWFSIPHNHLAVEILRIVQGGGLGFGQRHPACAVCG